MTTIAVLGNGRVGGNLAAALARAGHEVTVADRTPGAAADAARTARIIINATPGAGSLDRLAALREELRDKILVDVSNATTDGPDGLPADLIYPGSSLAEQLQEALPETRVVKTLNTMLFPVMTSPATLPSRRPRSSPARTRRPSRPSANCSPTSAGKRNGSPTSAGSRPPAPQRPRSCSYRTSSGPPDSHPSRSPSPADCRAAPAGGSRSRRVSWMGSRWDTIVACTVRLGGGVDIEALRA